MTDREKILIALQEKPSDIAAIHLQNLDEPQEAAHISAYVAQ